MGTHIRRNGISLIPKKKRKGAAGRGGAGAGAAMGLYGVVRYHLAPPFILLAFPCVVQVLAQLGQGEQLEARALLARALGSAFAWTVVGAWAAWAWLWLRLPARTVEGPATLFGYTPVYQDNGVLYYWASLVAFFTAQALWPGLSAALWAQMPELLGALNTTALLLCVYLRAKAKRRPEHPADRQPPRPAAYEFYCGLELHPRLLGVDVKQLTNCRIGMMGWQLLIIAFYVASVQRHGFSAATLVNLLLQSVFIAKFFWWEAGYFSTLDITLDRAGYYLCWGCLVWVPCLYTYSSYFLVAHPPALGAWGAAGAAALGMAGILLNYRVDLERQLFRAAPRGQCSLWGRPASFLVVSYRDAAGATRQSRLLTSGCWGVARHLNYTFELVGALAWCLPGLGLGPWPFLYFFFLVVLLVHRTFRDEEKCAEKYGAGWEEYCKLVPYRLVPFVF
ncbi:Uncharacterized protein GBIM_17016 [Gryllus bimaculatus]|nr:Uncharacterized protein GBIM_17016 [Gryllus bimaculatus]